MSSILIGSQNSSFHVNMDFKTQNISTTSECQYFQCSDHTFSKILLNKKIILSNTYYLGQARDVIWI